MSEQLQRCPACPDRSCASKVLARLGRVATPTDCAGPTTVYRGEVTTQIRAEGEPAPPQDTWNSVTGSIYGGEQRYSRTDWQTETVCGRDPVEPQEGEVPYPIANGDNTWVGEDGQRYAAFIRGTERGVDDTMAVLAITRMLDSAE